MKKRILKIFASLFAVLFLVSAGLQYNDPDPYLWYLIYGVAAVASVLYVFDKLPLWLAVLAGLLFIGGGIFSWPAQYEGVTIGGGDINNIEEGREALGLFITSVVFLVYAISISRKRKLA